MLEDAPVDFVRTNALVSCRIDSRHREIVSVSHLKPGGQIIDCAGRDGCQRSAVYALSI